MRYWGENLLIDGSYLKSKLAQQRGVTPGEQNAELYEKTIQDLIRMLVSRSTVAKVIIGAINKAPRQLRIIPMTLAERFGPTSRGAWPVATDFWGAQSKKVSTCQGTVCSAGTATGSDIVLNYEPYSWAYMDAATDPHNITRPEDVLLHELVHCLRMMLGLSENGPVKGPFKFREELFAVMVANMYRGQVGRGSELRGDYEMIVKPMAGKWTTSAWNFYHDYEREIRRFCKEHVDESRAFTLMNGFWNPFSVLYDEDLVKRS